MPSKRLYQLERKRKIIEWMTDGILAKMKERKSEKISSKPYNEIRGTQWICSSKHLFLWSLQLARKKKEQINSMFIRFLTNHVKCNNFYLLNL